MTYIHRSAAFAVALLALTACGSEADTDRTDQSDQRLVVAAAFYPIEAVVRAVGGDAIDVVTIVPPGEEAHEYEPTPQQVTRLGDADVVFFLGDEFQPNVERALDTISDGVEAVDILDGLTTLDDDPHVWLSIANMRAITETVRSTLIALSPDSADVFTANAARYDATLATLDGDFTAGLSQCATTYLVTGHRAFEYLARDYGLTQVAIAGVSPGDEPSAKELSDIADIVEARGVSTVFFEENLPSDLARTVADETGARTATLNNAETLSNEQLAAGDDYVSIMRANLAALRDGLDCS